MKKIKKVLRKYFVVIMSLILLLTSTNMSGVIAAENEEEYKNYNLHITVERNYDYAREVCRIVNEERRKEGIEPVVLDEQLTEWAMIRAKEIGYFYEHSRPCKKAINSLFKEYHVIAMENIAMCETLPEHAMQDWMNSPGHRRNIMLSDWVSVGIGCVRYNGTYCWVQLFSEKKPVQEIGHSNITSVEDLEVSSRYLKMSAKDFPSQLQVGNTAVFTLSQINVACEQILFVPNADSFDYESSDQSIASIDANGNVQAISPGTVALKAYYAGTSDVAYSTVLTCNGTQILSVTKNPTASPVSTIKPTVEPVSTPITTPSSTPTSTVPVLTTTPDIVDSYEEPEPEYESPDKEDYTDISEVETEQINIQTCNIVLTSTPKYAGKAVRPRFRVLHYENNGYCEELESGVDYVFQYLNNTKTGTGKIKIRGIGRYQNTKEESFVIHSKKYTVTFKKNNGTKAVCREVSWGKKVKKIATPKKKGYIFKGWYTSGGKKYNFSSRVTKNMVLSAKWKRK